MTIQLHHADCRDALAKMPADSVDTIICDPPYGLAFMGKAWDQQVPGPDYWSEALRVAKPGATLLAFGGTRTWHHLAVAIEQAGWEIRDCMMWLYGSGFPKSLDISKAIDKAAGAVREVVGHKAVTCGTGEAFGKSVGDRGGATTVPITAPATDAAKLWHGWGTALKPAWEPIIVAMKPTDGTFAENAQRHGVAGMAIDAARIPHVTVEGGTLAQNTHLRASVRRAKGNSVFGMGAQETAVPMDTAGRWPANVLLDDDAAAALDEQSGKCGAASPVRGTEASEPTDEIYGKRGRVAGAFHGDTGGASRFYYVAKASRSERGEGNDHPTVKPLALMRYLCRLTKTPTGGIVLDPFVGSGTTLLAAQAEGRDAIGIEIDAHHYAIARRRCAWTSVKPPAKA